jgi:hypothetical protein
MKNIKTYCTILMAAGLLALACNPPKAGTDAQQTQTPPNKPTKPNPTDEAEQPLEEAYPVAGFEKTPCFGKCPVYTVQFFSNGKVTWLGRMNVERMGAYEAFVTEGTLKSIRDRAFELNYLDLYNEYPHQGKRVADLPSTITFLRVSDIEKQVVNTHDAPHNLKQFEKYLEEIINGLAWRKVGGE